MLTRTSSATPAAFRASAFTLFASFAALFVLLASGCGGHHTGGNPTPTPSTTTDTAQPGWAVETANYAQTAAKPWTVLVYMGAANNLDTYALANINELEQVGSTANVNFVVQIKRGSGYDANAGYNYDSSEGGWSGTRRYYITKDGNTSSIQSTLISTNDTLDMGDYRSMQAFVQWGIAAFPATHYCLVVWNHGSGWRAEKIGATTKSATAAATRAAATTVTATAKTRGVEFDDVSSNYIKTTQFPAAIDMGGGRKWDLVMIDSSLMQMMEIAYQIKDKTSYILGSEESPPAGGYPYQILAGDLDANPSWNGLNLGADMAQKTLAFYNGQPTIGGLFFDKDQYANYVTQSVVDTSQLANVASAFDALGTALKNAKSTSAAQIAAARDGTEQYGVDDLATSDPTYQIYESYRDGEDFLNRLISTVSDSGVKSAATSANSALQAAILVNYHGTSHANSHGLSFYIPSPSVYSTDDGLQASGGLWEPGTSNDRYSSLAFPLAAPNWQSFLVNAGQ